MPSTSPRNSTKILKKIQTKTIFGKKETNIKKVKVFCDPSTSAPKIQGLKETGGGGGGVQVPRKRIKISSQQPKVEHLNLFENIDELNQIVCKSKCESTFGQSLSMPIFFPSSSASTSTDTLTIKQNQISFSSVDLLSNSPCSSNLQKSNDLSEATTSSETKILPPKSKSSGIPRIVNKKKFEKTSVSLSKIGDSTKIKKKRILKTDSGLKRKKIRAKSVWH